MDIKSTLTDPYHGLQLATPVVPQRRAAQWMTEWASGRISLFPCNDRSLVEYLTTDLPGALSDPGSPLYGSDRDLTLARLLTVPFVTAKPVLIEQLQSVDHLDRMGLLYGTQPPLMGAFVSISAGDGWVNCPINKFTPMMVLHSVVASHQLLSKNSLSLRGISSRSMSQRILPDFRIPRLADVKLV